MRFFNIKLFIILLTASMLVIVACSEDTSKEEDSQDADDEENSQDADPEKGEEGGTLKIAINASPPTLDPPTSTATATRDASRLIFETLVTTNSNYESVPMLAEDIDSEDNQTYTIKLREGVKFHNGNEMTSEDVVPSMERWLEKSGITGNIFNDATWTAEDEYTVILELAKPSSLALDTMASTKQAAAIMPKEIVESAPVEGIEEYTGTGPFKFVEWKQDQYIHYEKFEDYQPLDSEPDGLSGKKEALVDEIFINTVPDTSTRLTGLLTGEYDIAYSIPYDDFDQLENDPNLENLLIPAANEMMGFNKAEGIATDQKIRQAVYTALDANEVMFAAFPNEDFYWLDSGYMDYHIKPWASTAGSEYYNQADPDEAKELLEEAGYDGEEFRIMTSRDYDHHYNVGVVIHETLKELGMNAKLVVYDWPTLVDKRDSDLGAWDATITSASTVSTPAQLIGLSPTWGGGFEDDHVQELMADIEFAPTVEEAQEVWDELQLYSYEELMPIAHFGGYNTLMGHRVEVEGLTENIGLIYWNVSVTESE